MDRLGDAADADHAATADHVLHDHLLAENLGHPRRQNPGDDVGRAIYRRGTYEPAMLRVLERHLRVEQGDIAGVADAARQVAAAFVPWIEKGYAIIALVPSCALMFKQELPLMFPDDEDVKAVAEAMFDPFEYLVARDKDGLLRKDFKRPLGNVSYHIPCHSRVQNVGQKTREVLDFLAARGGVRADH